MQKTILVMSILVVFSSLVMAASLSDSVAKIETKINKASATANAVVVKNKEKVEVKKTELTDKQAKVKSKIAAKKEQVKEVQVSVNTATASVNAVVSENTKCLEESKHKAKDSKKAAEENAEVLKKQIKDVKVSF